jgi:hypothetical protein
MAFVWIIANFGSHRTYRPTSGSGTGLRVLQRRSGTAALFSVSPVMSRQHRRVPKLLAGQEHRAIESFYAEGIR